MKKFKIISDSIVKGDSIGHLVCETIPVHPHSLKLPDRDKRYIPVHVVVMENHLGRLLRKDEEVHHKDENPKNNSLSNLELVTHGDHSKHHMKENEPWRKSPRTKPGKKRKATVVAFVRSFADLITAAETNPIIKYETKSHYGGPELVYVVSEHKDALQILTGSKTLSDRHIKALKDMGFKFELSERPRKVL